MHRGALRLGAFLWTLTPCVSVLAHGEPPAAYAVLSHDAQGARAVRLSAGLALRRAAQRFQFVCPAAWGDQYAAPLAALADGTIIVGATSGLMLLSEDGKVRQHPDPAAAGNSTDVVRSTQGAFSLRNTQQGTEVLAVDTHTVRTLWKGPSSLYSLVALEDKLVLLRNSGTTLEQVTIAAADGKELGREVAVVASPVDYAFARATPDAVYALVVFRTASVLGTLRMNAFSEIAQAELSIAGPLRIGESTLLALDGKLSQLVDGQPKPLAAGDNVLCLEQDQELSYACNPNGIARVSAQAVGEPLFQFGWLVAPNLELLPTGEARDRCNAQWQDLRVDLLMVGTSLLEDAMSDAGTAFVDADAGTALPNAGSLVDAAIIEGGVAAPLPEEADSGQMGAPGRRKAGGASCAALPRNGGNSTAYLYAFVFALGLVLARHIVRSQGVDAGSDTEKDF